MNLSLICNDKTLQTVTHRRTTFFVVEEHMRGKPFVARVTNKHNGRVAFFMSMDGVCVQTGNTDWTNYRQDCRAYLLDQHRSQDVKGIRTSQHTEGEFVFTEEARSYATAIGSSTNAKGSIGLISWSEYVVPNKPSYLTPRTRMSQGLESMGGGLESMGGRFESLRSTEKGVGVGMGRDVQSNVRTAEFEWGHMLNQTTYRYATRAQLISWGILYPEIPAVDAFPKPAQYAARVNTNPYEE